MQNLPARNAEPLVGRPVRVVGSNADVVVGTLDDFVLLLWRRRVVPAGVTWAREAFVKLVSAKEDRKLMFLTVLLPGCDLGAPGEVRKDVAALLKTYEGRLACAAIVFENPGFGMTIVRSVITAINMTSRSRFPNAVFGKIDTALTWMISHRDARDAYFVPARIVEAIAQLRVL